jgi:hypothetical protein
MAVCTHLWHCDSKCKVVPVHAIEAYVGSTHSSPGH